MAGLAVADKRADDDRFEPFLRAVAAHADDDRPLVRRGASWALRQIGKRSRRLNRRAIEVAEQLRGGGGGARWVGTDALRELRSPGVQARLPSADGAGPSRPPSPGR